jgi:hypothetical protein
MPKFYRLARGGPAPRGVIEVAIRSVVDEPGRSGNARQRRTTAGRDRASKHDQG